MTLFILGNGFDLAHSLPTSYKDFLHFIYFKYIEEIDKDEFMNNKFKEFIDSIDINLTEIERDYDKDGVPDRINNEYAVKWFMSLFKYISSEREYWNELEKSLGEIDFSYIVYSYNNEDINDLFERDSFLYSITYQWPELACHLNVWLKEWIASINLESPNFYESIKRSATNSNDYFVTFNYTMTLEHLYHGLDSNILHIHGKNGDDEYVFGSDYVGDTESIFPSPSSADNINCVMEKFSKKIQKTKLKEFLNTIDRESDIKVIGFSFGKVDLPYIKMIHSAFPNAHWTLNSYNKCEDERHKEILIKEVNIPKNQVIIKPILE